MPLLTVVTAALRPRPEHVQQAWESIVTSAPADWDLEWCFQHDGEGSQPPEFLPEDERVRYEANGVDAGAAATRNAALARAKGDWFVNLDSDDFYTSQGLTALTALVDAHPCAVWIAARAHDIHEEGQDQELVEFPDYLPEGLISPQEFRSCWDASGLTFPFHPAGAGMRTDAARALGGYAATPFGEDLALFAAAAELAPGAYTSTPAFHYRRWSGQTTRKRDVELWPHIPFAHQRIAAIRTSGLRFSD
jgi:glycosyltransferase involved in cell wall biosynthesis